MGTNPETGAVDKFAREVTVTVTRTVVVGRFFTILASFPGLSDRLAYDILGGGDGHSGLVLGGDVILRKGGAGEGGDEEGATHVACEVVVEMSVLL
jgi:hypothetical protein